MDQDREGSKMVFESLVADLLNRFLGDFVDNLDSSQLNLGIWGGTITFFCRLSLWNRSLEIRK